MHSLTTFVVVLTAAAISAIPFEPVRRFPDSDCDFYNGKPCSATTERGCCDPGVSSRYLECDVLDNTLYVGNMPYNEICNQTQQN